MTAHRKSSGNRRRKSPNRTLQEQQTIIEDVLRLVADGLTLPEIEAMPGMPPRQTLNTWIARNECGVADRYHQAREVRADRIAMQIFDLADNVPRDMAAIQAARLQVDVRKWYLSKLLPEKYGDNVTKIEVSASNAAVMVGSQAIDAVAECRRMLDNAINIDDVDSE